MSFPGASVARWLRASAYEVSGVHARQRERLDGTCAAILMYHRVLPADEAARLSVEPGMYVTPETFARHLGWMKRSFRILPLSEVIEHLSQSRRLPKHACAITFDDGWRDNFDHAFPALQQHDLSAAIFLVVNRIGTPGAFWPDELARNLYLFPPEERAEIAREFGSAVDVDPIQFLLTKFKTMRQDERDAALEKLRATTPSGAKPIERELMDWEEIQEMAAAGIEFESHGLSHAILTGIDLEAAEVELLESRAALLERGLGGGGVFAYPSGAHNTALQSLVRKCGYHSALTTIPGVARCGDESTTYSRIGVHEDISRTRAEFHRRVPGAGTVPQPSMRAE